MDCKYCSFGYKRNDRGDIRLCEACKGTGVARRSCPGCGLGEFGGGSGYLMNHQGKIVECSTCHGEGWV